MGAIAIHIFKDRNAAQAKVEEHSKKKPSLKTYKGISIYDEMNAEKEELLATPNEVYVVTIR